jgi:hypothetical protein
MNTITHDKSAAESSAAKTTETNPYLQPVLKEQAKAPTNGNGNELHSEAEQDAAADRTAEEQKLKQRRRRRIVKTVILTLFFASVVIAVGLYRQRSTRVEYGQVGKQTQVLPPPPNVAATTARDSRSEQAIQDALRLTDDGNTTDRKEQGAANAASSDASQTAHSSGNKTENPFVFPDSADALNKSERAQKDSAPVSTNDQPPLRSQRSSETSLYVTAPDERPHPPSLSSEPPNAASVRSKHAPTETTVVLPPFGSMLPVRTIGGLYTLRSGALARLELTRDIVGNGWSMKRGTILVGATKGGEYHRAYLSLVGFIDPQSGKLVKLGGDVLGGDGAVGLKGKSRQVDSRWARVLSQVGNAALTLTGAFLGGRGNGTVIIPDGSRSPLINPVSGELDGVIGSQLDKNRRTGFVEVTGGTPGYVMVTDLPAAIQGTDASAELNNQTLASLSDVDAIRPATGMSEREFAELIANGSPEEIKARLQRMSPEMRKIALAVLER